MKKMHISTIESITQHKIPRMTNHSDCGRFGRVYNYYIIIIIHAIRSVLTIAYGIWSCGMG